MATDDAEPRSIRRGHLRLVASEPPGAVLADQVTSLVAVARALLPTSALPEERKALVRQDLETLTAEARRESPREDVCQALVLSVVDELSDVDDPTA